VGTSTILQTTFVVRTNTGISSPKTTLFIRKLSDPVKAGTPSNPCHTCFRKELWGGSSIRWNDKSGEMDREIPAFTGIAMPLSPARARKESPPY